MPRLGTNGGLIGPRRVATTGNASGSWALDEQCDAVRQAIWPSTGGDPYWANVSLLLHMDGSNGSTTFTDSSQYSRTPTSSTGALTTAKSKFGSASFSGGNAVSDGNVVWYGAYPGSIDYSYTIECWLYRSSSDVTAAGIFSFGDETSGRANIYYTTSDNRIEWEQYAIGVRYSLVVPLNSWFHFAIVRTAESEVFFFVNGVKSGPIAGVPFGNSGKFVIWAKPSDSHMDEIRLTSVARYTSNFTPPTAPFPNF